MSPYRLPRIAELAHQLRLSPSRLRLQQLLATDHLLTLIEPAHYYPYSWVCWHITGYKSPVGAVDPANLRGSALTHDLLLLCQDLTRQNPIPQTALPWPTWTLPELAERLNISIKTISRWRDDGLPAWWIARVDGQARLAIPDNGLRRFVSSRLAMVLRSRRFSQMSDKQREQILLRARQLRVEGMALSAICQTVAAEVGRSPETVRYTLARYDSSPKAPPLRQPEACPAEHPVIFECWQAGDTPEALAKRFGRTPNTIRRIVLHQQRRGLLSRKVNFIYSPEFDLPDAEDRILGGPVSGLAEPSAAVAMERPTDGTGLLGRDRELTVFRQYNYCKFRLSQLLQQLRKCCRPSLVEQAQGWTKVIDAKRAQLVEANLRLVRSIAQRHATYGLNLDEMASEGNMILMRAIEKFDYTRGFKFSTYGTWAIKRHFARLVPLWLDRRRRVHTGCQEVLEAASTQHHVGAALDQQLLGGLFKNLLAQLPVRERKIIQWHYGLPAGRPARSLTQIAESLGISKERVRQVEARGLARIKTMLDQRQFHYL